MSWKIKFLPEAEEDFQKLDGSNRILVRKALKKVSENPVSTTEGDYGRALSNLSGSKLAGFFKIKLRAAGIRIVYKLVRQEDNMLIVVIGARADNEVHELAGQRIMKNGL